ncbi:MAG TPA: hypothetical protein VGP08_12430 [Pyrinomonadaceae bacterium]|jgi:hypothetical protein|nr:hypothetical protein [Pyrinomonadaceae bacterium]
MRNSRAEQNRSRRVAVIIAVFFALASLPLLVGARARAASINVVNDSGREIVNLYLSHADVDDWGSDLLPNSTIANGQSFTISDVSWDQPQLKVVVEDSNGCFLSTVVSSSGDSTWTLSADGQADCGGN